MLPCVSPGLLGTDATNMQHQHDTRTEAALYWAAVSLIVCEGLSIEKAADQLGVEGDELTSILHRRQSLRPSAFGDASLPSAVRSH
jgi:hypothetical protein